MSQLTARLRALEREWQRHALADQADRKAQADRELAEWLRKRSDDELEALLEEYRGVSPGITEHQ